MGKRFSKIYIEITNYCNLKCSFCSVDNLPKREMTRDEFNIVINRVKNYTDSIYLHVKGEPLMHQHLDDILNICDNNKINVRITTNGTLLKLKQDILSEHCIKQINVSLHSENNDTNYYKNVFETCDALSKNKTIIYRLWTLSSLKLDKSSMRVMDILQKHYKLSTEIMNKIKTEKNIKICDNIYIDKDYEFNWPTIGDKKSDIGTCLGTKSHIAILSNGNVTPCCLDSQGIITLGNIFNSDLDSIINSKSFKKIYEGFNKHQIVHDLCKSCSYRKRFEKNARTIF